MSEYFGVYDDIPDDSRDEQDAELWDRWQELVAGTRVIEVPKSYKFGPGMDQTKLWVTKEGKSLYLEHMTPSHRGNVVRMLERKVTTLPGLTVEALHETPLIQRLKELGTE